MFQVAGLAELESPVAARFGAGTARFTSGKAEYILAAAPVRVEHGMVSWWNASTARVSNAVRQLDESEQRYVELSRERKLAEPHLHVAASPHHDASTFRRDVAGCLPGEAGHKACKALGDAMQAVSRGELHHRVGSERRR